MTRAELLDVLREKLADAQRRGGPVVLTWKVTQAAIEAVRLTSATDAFIAGCERGNLFVPGLMDWDPEAWADDLPPLSLPRTGGRNG